ncbi:MAG: hypothetical protein HYW48_12075 [Deltaproteobacteria bacterium]|nr:hypothetical protein [Deltaproteobacteria bacterium]
MHNYDSMKQKHVRKVCQTIDSPITIFDYFELGEMMVALLAMMIFGIVIYSWKLMFLSLFVTLGIGPVIRRRNKAGIFLHLPYRHLRMSLPGLVNPGGHKRFSD